jgi:hypothetical protein
LYLIVSALNQKLQCFAEFVTTDTLSIDEYELKHMGKPWDFNDKHELIEAFALLLPLQALLIHHG